MKRWMRGVLAALILCTATFLVGTTATAGGGCQKEAGTGVVRIECSNSTGPVKPRVPEAPPEEDQRVRTPLEMTEATCVEYTDAACATLLYHPPDTADPVAPPDPAALARHALAVLRLAPPDLRLTPPPDPGDPNTLVNTPTHLWLPVGTTLAPQTSSATDRGLTVTVEARLDHITLTTDDPPAASTDCTPTDLLTGPPASPFDPPACGHVWRTTSADRPGGAFHLTVTYHWGITWTGGGRTGTLTTTTAATYDVAVRERPVTLRPDP